MVVDLAQSHNAMGCNIFIGAFLRLSLRLHSMSRDGERFHQDISTMAKRHQGQWPGMLAHCGWTLTGNVPQAKYSRSDPLLLWV